MAQSNVRGRIDAYLHTYFSGQSIHYRQIVSLYLPILIDSACLTCLSLANTSMISSSGVEAVSAVSMIDSINIFLISSFVALSTGGTVVVAQYKGSGNESMVSKAAANTVSAVFLFALSAALFMGLLHLPLLHALFGAASPGVFSRARVYLIGSSLSYVGIAVQEAVCGALRGIGKTRASLKLSLIMNVTYVILNVLLINILHLGVLGLVISANISRYSAAVIALFFLARLVREQSGYFRFKDLFHFDFPMLKKILFIGIPFASEQLFFNGGKLLTQVFIVSLGTYALATNAICNSICGLLQIPSGALSLTAITVVGQCIGRRDIADARKMTKSFLGLSAFSSVLVGLIIIPLFWPLVGLFHPPSAIEHDILVVILIAALAQIPFWPISFILPAALRAAGDSKFTSISSMLSMWLFRVVLGYVLGIMLHFGIIGVWVAMCCEWGVRGIIFTWRFRGEQWYKHRLIEPAAGK